MSDTPDIYHHVVYVDGPEGRRYVSSVLGGRVECTPHLYVAIHLPQHLAQKMAMGIRDARVLDTATVPVSVSDDYPRTSAPPPTVLERVVLLHSFDETWLAVDCANAIASATGAPVGIGQHDGRVRWWLFRDRTPLPEPISP